MATKNVDSAKLKLTLELQDGLLTVTGADVAGIVSTTTDPAEAGGQPKISRQRVTGELALPEKIRSDLARLVEARLRGGA